MIDSALKAGINGNGAAYGYTATATGIGTPVA
jgi:hypothetical protein